MLNSVACGANQSSRLATRFVKYVAVIGMQRSLTSEPSTLRHQRRQIGADRRRAFNFSREHEQLFTIGKELTLPDLCTERMDGCRQARRRPGLRLRGSTHA